MKFPFGKVNVNWNVVALANTTGVVQERMAYSAFGKINWLDAAFVTKAASGYTWNRTFTGQVLDNETGLMLYRNRFYHATLGRFVSRDPIGYDAGDKSLYRYVFNQSIVFHDPFGLWTYGPTFPKPKPKPKPKKVCDTVCVMMQQCHFTGVRLEMLVTNTRSQSNVLLMRVARKLKKSRHARLILIILKTQKNMQIGVVRRRTRPKRKTQLHARMVG